jgi:putative protease
MTKKPISLLAPARSLEAGIIAINHGADEIYIGAPKFGARQAAGNSIEDIAELIKYAHKFNVKVFVALNTLLFSRELEEAEAMIWKIYEAGADALIIQDMGILELNIPPIPLHASTQVNNVDIAHIQFLEKTGFSRVILARELSVEEISKIKENTTIELETFIHGSLCVSYSGQCYLSHSIGNRSANRGACAQPCRLNYNLEDETGKMLISNKHLLSLRDLNLSNHIPQLISAGVCSLKIEGRLKDNAYIANVVSHYRNIIDRFLSENPNYCKSSAGEISTNFIPDIDKTFNRGYSYYFIENRTGDITAHNSPKSLGKEIGMITRTTPMYAEIDAKEPLKNGDGICFFSVNGELQGAYINAVDGNRITPSNEVDWQIGTVIYRNLDTAFEKQLQADKTKRQIPCSIVVEEQNQVVVFKATDLDSNEIATFELTEITEATNQERARDICIQQLSKSGASLFTVKEVNLNIGKIPFLTTAQINEIRRELLENLEEKRIGSYKREVHQLVKNNIPYPLTKIDFNGNISNEKSKAFFERHGAELMRWAPEKWGYQGGEALMTTKYCLKHSMGWCKVYQKPEIEVPEHLFLTHENQRFKLVFDCKKCVMKVFKTEV